MDLQRKLIAELLGTLWLVLGGCGNAVLAAKFLPDPNSGIGFLGVSIAFGLTVVTGAYALGHISGGHFNPAVTLGVFTARRIELREAGAYFVAQVIGGILGMAILLAIATGVDGFKIGTGEGESTLAANGWAQLSPGGYDWVAAVVVEVVLTFFFLLVILGVTGREAPDRVRAPGHRPIADADPPHQHPRHQHLGEPGPVHRTGGVRGRRRARTAVAVLAGAPRGRGAGRAGPPPGDRGAGRHHRGPWLGGPADRALRRAPPRGNLLLGRSSTAGPPSSADHRKPGRRAYPLML